MGVPLRLGTETNQLKVCFLAGTLGRGGAERQLVYMLRALGQVGVTTRVLCLTKGESFEQEIRSLGVPVEWIGDTAFRPRRLLNLVKALKRHPVDILQSAHFYTNLYGAVAGRITRTRDIGAVRSNLQHEFRANGLMGRWQLGLPRHLIVNSELARQRAIARDVRPDRIDLVKNAVDLQGLRRKTPCNECDSTIRILFAGRLVKEKRPDIFLQVVNEVINKLQPRPVRAIIAGDGPLMSELESLATSLGMDRERLEFLGECSEMGAVYQRADMLVMTSEHEGTPNVLLEAMACGLPVISTSVGGVPDILAEGRGLLVASGDKEGLKAAVFSLASNASLRAQLGERGFQYVSRSHSLTALGQHLIGIYERILSQ